jgi:hypothetical protein
MKWPEQDATAAAVTLTADTHNRAFTGVTFTQRLTDINPVPHKSPLGVPLSQLQRIKTTLAEARSAQNKYAAVWTHNSCATTEHARLTLSLAITAFLLVGKSSILQPLAGYFVGTKI